MCSCSKLLIATVASLALVPLSACQAVKPMKPFSNGQLLAGLQSPDEKRAHEAANEIFAKGSSVIPMLASLRGNKKPFAAASWLGRPTAGQMTFPSDVPVEVAALYLINAIYEGDIGFAQSPYLTDLTVPADKRKAQNSAVLIDKA